MSAIKSFALCIVVAAAFLIPLTLWAIGVVEKANAKEDRYIQQNHCLLKELTQTEYIWVCDNGVKLHTKIR